MSRHGMTRLLTLFMCMLLAALPAQAAGYEEHLLLEDAGCGTCTELAGQVEMLVVFVSTDGAVWSRDGIAAMQQEIQSAARTLEREAASYGAALSLSISCYTAQAQAATSVAEDSESWVDAALSSAALPARTSDAYRGKPLIFCLTAEGRAFAHSEHADSQAEYAVLFNGDGADACRHELLHLYGAWDYYLPGVFLDAAKMYFPDSIMLSASDGSPTDDVTARIVGWTDTLTPAASAFFADTEHITREAYTEAQEGNRITGHATIQLLSGVYTGTLIDGSCHGLGEMHYDSGDVCVGQWYWGAIQGVATYTWADGSSYTGDFVNNVRQGKGTITWADGSCYTGDFINGKRHGKGTLTWADGTVYSGDLVNDERTGTGTLLLSDGSSYSGSFVNNSLQGKGIFTWADGNVYSGDFANGKRHGKGTFTWANGNVYSGDFVDGARTGKGSFFWANGDTYTGGFLNDALHGKGTYTWANGDIYSGSYVNSSRTGSGVFLWANGNMYTGDFVDGAMSGEGTFIWPSGERYSGSFVNGVRHGKGTYTWASGDTYTGDFVNGQFNGSGVYRSVDGVVLDGQWADGQFIQ